MKALPSLLVLSLIFATDVYSVNQAGTSSGGYQKAVQLTTAGQSQAALELWNQLLSKNPADPTANYYAGVCYFNLGNFTQAGLSFKKGISSPQYGNNAYYYLGRVAEMQRNSKLAIENYQLFLSKNPSEKGRAEAVKRLAALGVKSAPEAPAPKAEAPATAPAVNYGQFKLQPLPSGHLFVIWAAPVKGNDGLGNAWSAVSRNLMNQGIETLKEINRDYPDSPPSDASRFNLMSLYLDLGLNDKVLSVGNILLDKGVGEPMRSGVYAMMAEAALNQKATMDAGQYLQNARAGGAFGPSQSQKITLQGLIESGGKSVPFEKLRQAAQGESNPLKKAQLEVQMASQIRDSRPAEAMNYYRSAVEHCGVQKPDFCRKAYYGVADLAYKQKRWDEARNFYNAALRTHSDQVDSPWGMFQLANIERQAGNLQGAISAYDRLLGQFGNSKWAEQAKWRRADVVWRQQHPGLLKR